MSRKNERMSIAVGSLRRKTQDLSFSNKFPKLKTLVTELGMSGESAVIPKPTPPRPISANKYKQNDHVRDLLKKTFKKENIYRVKIGYTGYGISDDLVVEVNDIVAVIKKSDPCGNAEKWFVDNGCKLSSL